MDDYLPAQSPCQAPHVWVEQPDGSVVMRCDVCGTIISIPAGMMNRRLIVHHGSDS